MELRPAEHEKTAGPRVGALAGIDLYELPEGPVVRLLDLRREKTSWEFLQLPVISNALAADSLPTATGICARARLFVLLLPAFHETTARAMRF